MKVKLIYENKQDMEFLRLLNLKIPFFVDYIDISTVEGRKEGFKILNYWSARKLPFIVVEDDEAKPIKIIYSEVGYAINQFSNWLNDCKN